MRSIWHSSGNLNEWHINQTLSNAANMSLKLSFVSQFTFPKKLYTTILSWTTHSKCLLWTLNIYDSLVWMVGSWHFIQDWHQCPAACLGLNFWGNFKSCITKAVCITHLNVLLRLMSGAIPILCLHGVQWGTSTYSHIVSWLKCQSNTFLCFLKIQTLF